MVKTILKLIYTIRDVTVYEYENKSIRPSDNASNMQNPNKGTAGTNRQYDQNQGNRGEQLNPNKKGK